MYMNKLILFLGNIIISVDDTHVDFECIDWQPLIYVAEQNINIFCQYESYSKTIIIIKKFPYNSKSLELILILITNINLKTGNENINLH